METEKYQTANGTPEYQLYLFQLAEELYSSPIYHPVDADPPYVQVLYHDTNIDNVVNVNLNESLYGYDATDSMLDYMTNTGECGMQQSYHICLTILTSMYI